MSNVKTKQSEPVISFIRFTNSIRVGQKEYSSLPITGAIEVTKKGKDYIVYDKQSRKVTEIPYHTIAYIQYEPSEEPTDEAGNSDTSGS